MMIDLRQALLREIVDELTLHPDLAVAELIAGWPGDVRNASVPGQNDDALVLPAVGVYAVAEDEERARRPDYRDEVQPDGTWVSLYAVADVVFDVNIELWAATKTERGTLEQAVAEVLDGVHRFDLDADGRTTEAPRRGGLRMELSRYHGVVTRLRRISGRAGGSRGKEEGYFSTTISCTATVPRVHAVRHNPAIFTRIVEVTTDDTEET